MLNISKYLEKFKKITPPERFIRELFIRVVFETTNITLKDTDIKVQGNIVYTTPHPVVKNELFLQKNIILEKLNQELQQYKKTITNLL